MIAKPQPQEYHGFYAGYVSNVIDEDIFSYLTSQQREVSDLFQNLPKAKIDFAYAPEKWTLKQLFRHMIDAERVFGYRAMCIARGEENNLPGFDEETYVSGADDTQNNLTALINEWNLVRASNLVTYQNFSPTSFALLGSANGSTVSVQALIYITAGHTAHHLRIMGERYL